MFIIAHSVFCYLLSVDLLDINVQLVVIEKRPLVECLTSRPMNNFFFLNGNVKN